MCRVTSARTRYTHKHTTFCYKLVGQKWIMNADGGYIVVMVVSAVVYPTSLNNKRNRVVHRIMPWWFILSKRIYLFIKFRNLFIFIQTLKCGYPECTSQVDKEVDEYLIRYDVTMVEWELPNEIFNFTAVNSRYCIQQIDVFSQQIEPTSSTSSNLLDIKDNSWLHWSGAIKNI